MYNYILFLFSIIKMIIMFLFESTAVPCIRNIIINMIGNIIVAKNVPNILLLALECIILLP